jgi:hypothetical protein
MSETIRNPAEDAAVMIGKLMSSAVDVQKEMLAGLETITNGWFERQRDALDSSARSLRQMCECRNFADLFRVQQDLVSAYMHWTVAELRAAGRERAPASRKPTARLHEGSETGREKPAERVVAA